MYNSGVRFGLLTMCQNFPISGSPRKERDEKNLAAAPPPQPRGDLPTNSEVRQAGRVADRQTDNEREKSEI